MAWREQTVQTAHTHYTSSETVLSIHLQMTTTVCLSNSNMAARDMVSGEYDAIFLKNPIL